MGGWITVLWVMAALAAIAATVLFCIFLMPEKKAKKLPKFLRVIRDVLNMKELYLEKVLRVLYVCTTLFCIIAGGLMFFFGFGRDYWSGGVQWYGGYGLLLMIGGPIALRLVFEGLMMFILLVKNTMQINNKLKAQEAPVEEKAEEPVQEKPEVVIVHTTE